jgi:hypothetical protein
MNYFFVYNSYGYKGEISAVPQGMTSSGKVDDEICLTKIQAG